MATTTNWFFYGNDCVRVFNVDTFSSSNYIEDSSDVGACNSNRCYTNYMEMKYNNEMRNYVRSKVEIRDNRGGVDERSCEDA